MIGTTFRAAAAACALLAMVAASGCQSSSTTASAAADGERPATQSEIETVAVGRTLNGVLTYNSDGTYLYDGGSPGRYTISEGRICVRFNSGDSRCDRIVTADGGETFTMINASGRRFPFG